MANQFEDLIPKTKPLDIAEYGALHAHDYDWWTSPLGWLTIALIVAGVLIILVALFVIVLKIAMKLLYLTTFSATRGVHDGWYPPAPPPTPMPFRPALRPEEEQRVEIRKLLVMETLKLQQPELWKGTADRQLLDSFPPTARIGGQRRTG